MSPPIGLWEHRVMSEADASPPADPRPGSIACS